MTRARALALLLSALLLGPMGTLAHANEPTPAPNPPTATATPDDDLGGFEMSGQQGLPGDDAESSEPTPGNSSTTDVASATHWVQGDLTCETYSSVGCVTANRCSDGSIPVTWTQVSNATGEILGEQDVCPGDPAPTTGTKGTPPIDIPGEVLKEFKKVALPASTITVQPPGGKTLVNLQTILSTQATRHQIPIRLSKVNLNITLEVWPSHFTWHHGDGTTQESDTPGRPWTDNTDPSTLINHIYTHPTDAIGLSVDTTWSAQFKVTGQPDWRPVNGTVTRLGDTTTLAVVEAAPQLVR